jgi:hypothetical protein
MRSFEAIQIGNILSEVLEGTIHLPPTLLYDHPSVSLLSAYLVQLLDGGIPVSYHFQRRIS